MERLKLFTGQKLFGAQLLATTSPIGDNGHKRKVHVRCGLVHVNIRRDHVAFPVSVTHERIHRFKKISASVRRKLFWLRDNPVTQYINVCTLLHPNFAHPLVNEVYLRKLLVFRRQIIIQRSKIRVDVFVPSDDVFGSLTDITPTIMVRHVTDCAHRVLLYVCHFANHSLLRPLPKGRPCLKITTQPPHLSNGVASYTISSKWKLAKGLPPLLTPRMLRTLKKRKKKKESGFPTPFSCRFMV